MTDVAWKAWERTISKWFGGQRRGADFRGFAGGKNDVIKEGWSIEAKLLSRPSFSEILAACKQAEAAKENPTDIAVAVIRRKGDSLGDAIFAFRTSEFLSNFVSVVQDKEDERI